MRLPFAAFGLTLITVFVYFQSSGGLLYPSFNVVSQNAFGISQPVALLFHLFYHLGVKHFVGNVLPLFVFAFLLELSVASWEVVGLFLFSGLASALVFSILNPSSFLVGASSGVSALMTAAALLRPRVGLLFLVGVPILTFGILFPFLDRMAGQTFASLEEKQSFLEEQAAELERQQRFEEAQAAYAQAAHLSIELKEQKEGKQREESAQSDFLVHLTGALLGAAFVLWRHAKKLEEALEQLWPFFERIQRALGKS